MGDFSFIPSGAIDTTPFTGTVQAVRFASMWGPWSYYGIWLKGGRAGKMRVAREAPCPVVVGEQYTFALYIERKALMIRFSKPTTSKQ